MNPQPSIAHYRIIAKLGEGGMGSVYRASDTKLNRDVAIKVLPDSLANDPDYLARFTREAQVLAALNHPHIAAVYGVEDRAIVMELVEGRDLPTPLPLSEALPIARQIADALETAHEKGIVHRDLKPANIRVTPQGVVKVLDFGLAKAAEPASSDASATVSPTLTLRSTQAGMIMGTAAYMAPEQAAGKPVDKRADIWAFGVVLYELLTGARLFEGETVAHTLAGVLRDEINFAKLPAATPPAVRDLLARCLDRDPRTRLRDIGEARVILTRPLEPALPPTAASGAGRGRPVLPWTLAGVMTVASVAAVVWGMRGSGPTDRPLVRLDVDLGPTAAVSIPRPAPALSPDGSRIAFVVRGADGRQQLAVRSFDQPKSTTIPGTENPSSPFFSPDGQWLGFFADRKLKKVLLAGGAPVTLCDAAGPRGGSWGEDGNIVFTPRIGSGLWRIAASGGTPQPVTKPADQGQYSHTWPQVLRGGKSVLFTARRSGVAGSDDAEISLLSVDSGKWKTLRGGYFGRYLPSGHLVYVQNGALFGVRLNPDRGETEGTPVQLLDDVAGNTVTAAGYFDFARNGAFVYASGKPKSNKYQLSWLDSSGATQPLLSTPRQYQGPRLSPDGQWLALGIGNMLAGDVYIFDLRREILAQLTFSSAQPTRDPVWAPDSAHLAYATVGTANAPNTIWWIRRDGGGQPHKILESGQTVIPGSISPDGRHLAYSQDRHLWILPLEKASDDNPRPGKPEQFFESTRAEIAPAFSPDGRWLAYEADDSGRSEVYVRPYPGPGGKSVISAGEGRWPSWSADGRQIFYATSNGQIMQVDCQMKGDSILAGKPRVWPGSGEGVALLDYAVMRDGKRVAMVTPPRDELDDPKGSLHLMFLLNFFDELRRRIP